jgi:hypothetical protein
MYTGAVKTALINDYLTRFIEGSEKDPERLPMESSVFQKMFETYDITPRFADFLTRQHMPGRAVHYVPGSRELARHGMAHATTYHLYLTTHIQKSGILQ